MQALSSLLKYIAYTIIIAIVNQIGLPFFERCYIIVVYVIEKNIR
jgi:hypothetical protein